MAISTFDLFTIGIGPSSSHTVGPMRAARTFVRNLETHDFLPKVDRIHCDLYGSLAATGKGHGTDKAVLLGFLGYSPRTVDVDEVDNTVAWIRQNKTINLLNKHEIEFNEKTDLIMHFAEVLEFHANGMRFKAYDSDNQLLSENTFYSVGGGFIVEESALEDNSLAKKMEKTLTKLPHTFTTAKELLEICEKEQKSISEVMLDNEKTWRTEEEIYSGLLEIWHAMESCVERGCQNDGVLPGGLGVKRRAAKLFASLEKEKKMDAPMAIMAPMDWVNLYALAVNEENASGGRVVTAPTNGAAGIIPAVMHYYRDFCQPETLTQEQKNDGYVRFLLTAAAIGILFKENASISGAEVGCQGEVGSACSMAAAGLTEVLGGTPSQVENAAEIGIEHNLGLTCDPIGGLVQVPCIERNAMGSVKAINATRLALRGDGTHFVSLDKAILTMKETGKDMMEKYKETSRGGLAVNVIEC